MPIVDQSFRAPLSIQEVLDRLDEEIERAIRERDRNAYFAALYRGVTKRVMEGIGDGRFEDGPRMERLDVIFANRYLEALHAYQRRQRYSRSWKAAFDASKQGRLTILQHLLVGMNAHINLDLGVAAAAVSPGAEISRLKRDFDEISILLGEMLEDVQDRLTRVSPWLGLLDRAGGRTDEEICTFCLSGARDLAWRWADRFARADSTSLPLQVEALDRSVALLAVPILRPTPLMATALTLVRARESNDVGRVVAQLR